MHCPITYFITALLRLEAIFFPSIKIFNRRANLIAGVIKILSREKEESMPEFVPKDVQKSPADGVRDHHRQFIMSTPVISYLQIVSIFIILEAFQENNETVNMALSQTNATCLQTSLPTLPVSPSSVG